MNEPIAPAPQGAGGPTVRLVLVRPDGAVVGALPEFTVTRSRWAEVAEIIATCRAVHGVAVTILRLIDTEAIDRRRGVDGSATYLAEFEGAPPPNLEPWTLPLSDDPLRARWARPGGPEADVAWADAQLIGAARPRQGPAVQMKTWNLSSLWRLPTAGGDVWLKAVPPFFAHEGGAIELLASESLPPLIAFDALGRTLLENVAGVDQYNAPRERQAPMIDALVTLQVDAVDRVDALLALGAPDWRAQPFAVAAADVVTRGGGNLTVEDQRALARLLSDLDRRFRELAECGVPDTLVHGDFHTGNVRWTNAGPIIFDWGDCGVGNPLLDVVAFDRTLDPTERADAKARWITQWSARVPGCDAARAISLVEPLGPLRLAIIYRRFLDGIEETERHYHRADVPIQLRDAARLAARARAGTAVEPQT